MEHFGWFHYNFSLSNNQNRQGFCGGKRKPKNSAKTFLVFKAFFCVGKFINDVPVDPLSHTLTRLTDCRTVMNGFQL